MSAQPVVGISSQVHTHKQPYCQDRTCSCHSDAKYHEVVTGTQEASPKQLKTALKFFGVKPERRNKRR